MFIRFCLFWKELQINCNWFKQTKQKALDADPKAIQQIIFTGEAPNNTIRIYYILEQSKEAILEFAKGRTKFL